MRIALHLDASSWDIVACSDHEALGHVLLRDPNADVQTAGRRPAVLDAERLGRNGGQHVGVPLPPGPEGLGGTRRVE